MEIDEDVLIELDFAESGGVYVYEQLFCWKSNSEDCWVISNRDDYTYSGPYFCKTNSLELLKLILENKDTLLN